ncbi:GNAT family N-acetyltransferase [Paenibacillus albicereus]|uniref:GNAT family N-acetyltransferase n=1 Tax=Paenibacillus albicereus TaxID=2726185 RepID=A0A6H2GSD5_9BACL|nr:GNAT family N-acetyltransferase [Paenibacillus albicereus]QJC50341.1 GNAT family N-acetyltransferase [Paenibacillus albicereus]
MPLHILDRLDHPLWPAARSIYERSFPPHGRKPETLMRRMLERGQALVFVLAENASQERRPSPAAMALAGPGGGGKALIVDYLAVDPTLRGQGIGIRLLDGVERWAAEHASASALVIETEAGGGEENEGRRHFWERAGFVAPDGYAHRYIWVPEPYAAMYRPLPGREADLIPPPSGRQLFRWIEGFHARAYRGFREEE